MASNSFGFLHQERLVIDDLLSEFLQVSGTRSNCGETFENFWGTTTIIDEFKGAIGSSNGLAVGAGAGEEVGVGDDVGKGVGEALKLGEGAGVGVGLFEGETEGDALGEGLVPPPPKSGKGTPLAGLKSAISEIHKAAAKKELAKFLFNLVLLSNPVNLSLHVKGCSFLGRPYFRCRGKLHSLT